MCGKPCPHAQRLGTKQCLNKWVKKSRSRTGPFQSLTSLPSAWHYLLPGLSRTSLTLLWELEISPGCAHFSRFDFRDKSLLLCPFPCLRHILLQVGDLSILPPPHLSASKILAPSLVQQTLLYLRGPRS